jgi:hypothetical protein
MREYNIEEAYHNTQKSQNRIALHEQTILCILFESVSEIHENYPTGTKCTIFIQNISLTTPIHIFLQIYFL